MDTLTLVLLGVIAVASLAQAVSLLAVAAAGRDIARRVGGFERSLEREIRPALREASRLTRGLAEVSEVTSGQAHRLARALDTAGRSVTRAGTLISEALQPSAVKAANLVSVARALFELLNLSRRRRSDR
jgi:hypothetical protein